MKIITPKLRNNPRFSSLFEKSVRPDPQETLLHLQRRLDIMLAGKNLGLPEGERGNLYAWHWGYLGRAALNMYRATTDDRFLLLVKNVSERLLRVRDDALRLTDDCRGKVVPSWGTRFENGVRTNGISTAGLIVLPMCQYALETGDKEIGREAIATLTAFVDEQQSALGGIYFHELGVGRIEPINHANIYGAALAYCSEIPEAPPTFQKTAQGIYNYWMNFVRFDRSGLSWPYNPSPDSPNDLQAERIWKAGVTIELPVALAHVGLMKRSDTIPKIVKTILKNPVVRRGGMPYFIENKNKLDVMRKDCLAGSSLPGMFSAFVMLDNERIDGILYALMHRYPEFFPRGWLGPSRTMIMSYSHILSRSTIERA